MTKEQTRSAIRKLGFIVNVEDGEYRIALPVRCYGGVTEMQELEAYYTTDDDDALATAKAWRNTL